MCLAFPGRIIDIEGDQATVDFQGVQKKVNISLVKSVRVSDFVMVHAGFAIQQMKEVEAQEVLKLYEEAQNG